MDTQKIKRLTEEWEEATDKVIEFENPGYEKVRALFKETFEVLDKYGKEKLVPKEIQDGGIAGILSPTVTVSLSMQR